MLLSIIKKTNRRDGCHGDQLDCLAKELTMRYDLGRSVMERKEI